MKVLLDECLPRKLAQALVGHEVRTVPEAGWAGLKNGVLLAKAADLFDAFIAIDKNLSSQQNPCTLPIAVIVLHAKSNKFKDVVQLVPQLLGVLASNPPKGVHPV